MVHGLEGFFYSAGKNKRRSRAAHLAIGGIISLRSRFKLKNSAFCFMIINFAQKQAFVRLLPLSEHLFCIDKKERRGFKRAASNVSERAHRVTF